MTHVYAPAPMMGLYPETLTVGKNLMTLMNRTVVHIRWADTHLSEGGWLDMPSYEDDGECIVDTVGFLIPIGEPGSKENHVTVWQTICKEEGIHAIHIPVAMVRDMKAIDLTLTL